MKKIFLLLALLCFTVTALADFNTANIAEQKGDYQTAIKEYLPLAKAGDVTAQLNLSNIYIYMKNYPQGYYWAQKAADAGMEVAKTNLGFIYLNGWGVKKDYQKAYQLLKPQALKGDGSAQINLGYMYYYGFGVKKNKQTAAYWYKKAIHSNNNMVAASAANNLSIMYLAGELGQPDYNKGLYYLTRAANAGHTKAIYKLGINYEHGITGTIDYPEAYKWYSLAIKQGYKPAEEKLLNLKKKMSAAETTEGNKRINEFLNKYQQNLINAKHNIDILY